MQNAIKRLETPGVQSRLFSGYLKGASEIGAQKDTGSAVIVGRRLDYGCVYDTTREGVRVGFCLRLKPVFEINMTG